MIGDDLSGVKEYLWYYRNHKFAGSDGGICVFIFAGITSKN